MTDKPLIDLQRFLDEPEHSIGRNIGDLVLWAMAAKDALQTQLDCSGACECGGCKKARAVLAQLK